MQSSSLAQAQSLLSARAPADASCPAAPSVCLLVCMRGGVCARGQTVQMPLDPHVAVCVLIMCMYVRRPCWTTCAPPGGETGQLPEWVD